MGELLLPSYYEAICPSSKIWHFLQENQARPAAITLLSLLISLFGLKIRCGILELSHEIKNATSLPKFLSIHSVWPTGINKSQDKVPTQSCMIHVQTPSLIHNEGGNHPVIPRSLQSQPHLAETVRAPSFRAQSLAVFWILGNDQIAEEYSWAAGLTTHEGTVGN